LPKKPTEFYKEYKEYPIYSLNNIYNITEDLIEPSNYKEAIKDIYKNK